MLIVKLYNLFQVKKAAKKMKAKAVFVATDDDPMIAKLEKTLKKDKVCSWDHYAWDSKGCTWECNVKSLAVDPSHVELVNSLPGSDLRIKYKNVNFL